MNPYELKEWLRESPDNEIYLNSIDDVDEFYEYISEIWPGIEFEGRVAEVECFYEDYTNNGVRNYIAFWYDIYDNILYFHVILDDEVIGDAGQRFISFNELRINRALIEVDATEFVNLLSI